MILNVTGTSPSQLPSFRDFDPLPKENNSPQPTGSEEIVTPPSVVVILDEKSRSSASNSDHLEEIDEIFTHQEPIDTHKLAQVQSKPEDKRKCACVQ